MKEPARSLHDLVLIFIFSLSVSRPTVRPTFSGRRSLATLGSCPSVASTFASQVRLGSSSKRRSPAAVARHAPSAMEVGRSCCGSSSTHGAGFGAPTTAWEASNGSSDPPPCSQMDHPRTRHPADGASRRGARSAKEAIRMPQRVGLSTRRATSCRPCIQSTIRPARASQRRQGRTLKHRSPNMLNR